MKTANTKNTKAGNVANQTGSEAQTERLERKVDALTQQVETLVGSQQMLASLYEDMVPIATSALSTGANQLAELEQKGYFDFARESMRVFDAVVTGYTPDDVHALADNVVHILDLVKTVTQPEVLEFAEQAVGAAEDAGERKPPGVIKILRATLKDDDVRRGLAIGLEALRQIGKRANAAAHLDTADGKKVTALLGAKRNLKPSRPPPAKPAVTPPVVLKESLVKEAGASPAPAPAQNDPSLGVALDSDGFMTNPDEWTEDIAVAFAQALGVGELTEGHWKVLNFIRSEFMEKKASPNIRRINVGAGVPTKDLYALFPRAPAKTAAKIAGVKKPVGCV